MSVYRIQRPEVHPSDRWYLADAYWIAFRTPAAEIGTLSRAERIAQAKADRFGETIAIVHDHDDAVETIATVVPKEEG